MRRFFVVLVVLLTSTAGVIGGVTAAPAAIPAAQATNAETTSLISDINSYRATQGLPAIPVSPELTTVAMDHVHDLMQYAKTAPEYTGTDCVPHGWSSHGPWTGGCYKYADSSTYPIMWNKPKEIANYPGNGYEILYWSSGTATAADALKSWQSDGPHNDVIINQGIWKDLTWRAMGVWVEDGYASVWFGEQTDPTPPTAGTTTQPANANATKPANGGAPQLPAAAATTPANGGAPVLAPAATSTSTTAPGNGAAPSATSAATATQPANGGAPAVATTPANGGAPVLASTTTATNAPATTPANGGAPTLPTATTGGQPAAAATMPAGASPVTASQLATPVPNSETTKLIDAINAYRGTKGLPPIPVSPMLTTVAMDHVHDLMQYGKTAPEYTGPDCLPHSWSSHGPWTGGCYKSTDPSTSPIMWNKPKEIANYPGNGYEILFETSGTATAADALKAWQADAPHDNVIINQDIWKDLTWRAMGVWVEDGYASVWFGEQTDPTPAANVPAQPANNATMASATSTTTATASSTTTATAASTTTSTVPPATSTMPATQTMVVTQPATMIPTMPVTIPATVPATAMPTQ